MKYHQPHPFLFSSVISLMLLIMFLGDLDNVLPCSLS